MATFGVTAVALTNANAFELGSTGRLQPPGLVLGNAATAPPPGLYMFNQAFTYQSNAVGPGADFIKRNLNGGKGTSASADAAATGLLWVPGWTFLGGTYDAVIAQPFIRADFSSPFNFSDAGMHNTFIAPVELSWKLGDSGFFVKSGLGVWAPTGTQTGTGFPGGFAPALAALGTAPRGLSNGLGNWGNPWWTFQPTVAVSYLNDGWNLTANTFLEINTKNTITNYTSGDVLHVELTATKTIGKWTFGPVGYYIGQITDDKSSAFYNGAIGSNRYNVWAAGGLVGYDFGPAALKLWVVNEFSANASGGTMFGPGVDSAFVTKGWTVFTQLSYRLWAPDEPAATPKLYRK
ncbi:SphA family protein [Bradyrhizobium oligotrophicum]|uniref:SphA family protein n=1 Tax=Bradyrhizobium oligotrophicum TaxID=44255 RepID=UPI003EC006E2